MTNKTKTVDQQKEFSLGVLHDLQQAYDNALVCFHSHNAHQANYKHSQLLERLKTIIKTYEAHNDD